MKIATWNLERPTKNSKRLTSILELLKTTDADILILTETNGCIQLENYHVFHSDELSDGDYKAGEKRVSIHSIYPIIKQINTGRNDTSICVVLQTPTGELAVYGTVIGIHGNRRKSFTEDLDLQLNDIHKIGKLYPLCIAGDFNISFSDNYYFTKNGRDKLNETFKQIHQTNLTAEIPQNIDHIVLSNSFLGSRQTHHTQVWNIDKKLSDHIGVAVTIG